MLHQYLSRLYDTIVSRGDIEAECFRAEQSGRHYRYVLGRLRFYDSSMLIFEEILELQKSRQLEKTYYKYHYQHADGSLVFRYDNAPHYRDVSTFPHHVHVGEPVLPTTPPDLTDVLHRIDEDLYRATDVANGEK